MIRGTDIPGWAPSLVLVASMAGCIVPVEDPGTGDTDQGTDSASDSDTGDSGETGDTFEDTSLEDTQDTEDTGPQALGCHPYDPMETAGWTRQYSITENGKSGTETHEGLGQVTAPSNWPNQAYTASGYGHTVAVNFQGATNPATTTQLRECQAGSLGSQAVEIGYHLPNGSLEPVVVGAKAPRMYLPSEQEFQGFGYSGEENVDFRAIGQSQSICGFPPALRVCTSKYTLITTSNVTTQGVETLNIPALGGQVDAQKITYLIEQQVVKDTSFDIFGEIFGSILNFGGYQANGDRYNAEFTRWYVRGVGLVKEQAVDIVSKNVIVDKQLTACSGLPDCP